jgi:hypothetical protein
MNEQFSNSRLYEQEVNVNIRCRTSLINMFQETEIHEWYLQQA